MPLDKRQMEILATMGIDLWSLRDGPAASDQNGCAKYESGTSPDDVLVDQSSLASLVATIATCQKCQLHQTRVKTVPGAGNAEADWMFVGEAPGRNEDQQGEPFVGRAGQLLDAMIRALNMTREDVFIANVIKCRPPENRDPLPEEVVACEPYLHDQLELIKPKIIIALGRTSAQALLKTTESLGHLRGKIHRYGITDIPLVITYHPAYLLRSPQQKAKAWEDLLLAQSVVLDKK